MHADNRDLLIRALDEDLNAKDQKRLNALLRASPDARAFMDAHESVRAFVAEHGAASFDPDFTDRVMQRLPAPDPEAADRPAHRRADRSPRTNRRMLPWARMGWALAVVVLVGIGVWLSRAAETITVPHGERTTASLPDGSSVELSAGSTLRYWPFWWPGARTVTLDGEAFFDVATGDRSFVVETFNARIAVQGTRFNVRAWTDDPTAQTTVALTEGHVEVHPTAAKRTPVTLQPGDLSIVAEDTTETLSAETALNQALAWRSGGLAFVDQPLEAALRELERRFAVDITLADATLAEQSLTYLNPQPSSAEAALTDICHVLDLRFRRTAEGFTVLRK